MAADMDREVIARLRTLIGRTRSDSRPGSLAEPRKFSPIFVIACEPICTG